MDWREAHIVINNHLLTHAQAMAVRVAVEHLFVDVQENALGEDEHGRAMCANYRGRLAEIRQILYREQG